jgi:hypothetical protein
MTNTPTPPRSRIRSVIPNRICTKPESKAKENMPGLNADNFLGLLERKTKNTTMEIETEIKKICMFVRRGELSASPCAETIGMERIYTTSVKRYPNTRFFILNPPCMIYNLGAPNLHHR